MKRIYFGGILVYISSFFKGWSIFGAFSAFLDGSGVSIVKRKERLIYPESRCLPIVINAPLVFGASFCNGYFCAVAIFGQLSGGLLGCFDFADWLCVIVTV